jgi:hypothetical protein
MRTPSAAARERGLPCVDLFTDSSGPPGMDRLTDNGMQITLRGHGFVARAFARSSASRKSPTARATQIDGAWTDGGFERLRQAVRGKNQLWFDYWRPQNWAFLGGDRVSQPSSRDHRDPKIRWFPQEMERFIPLIETKEKEIAELAGQLSL